MSLLDQNIARWSKFSKEEAALLQDVDTKGYRYEPNDQGVPILTYEEEGEPYYFHNPENSLEEAQEALSKVNLEQLEVIYAIGIGQGIFFDAIQTWLEKNPQRQLVFLEKELAVLRLLFETEKGTVLLYHPQVWIYYLDKNGNILDALTDLFILKPYSCVFLPRYKNRFSLFVRKTETRIGFLSSYKYVNTFEYSRFGSGFSRNFFPNLQTLPQALLGNKLFGAFQGIPAIICGAGPSLAKNLPLLETLKDHALILAGATAMNAINANGFVPHFGVGIDPNTEQYTRLIANIAFETPYFYRNRLNRQSLEVIHGEHLYITGSGGYPIAKWFEEAIGILSEEITEGCNVVNFSLSIAKEMGCSPIILVGVDLAYTEHNSYAPGILTHPLHNWRDHFHTKQKSEELIVKPDIYGKDVFTLWKWVMESFWYSQYAAQNRELVLINATEGGLGFTGVPNMSLQEVKEKFLLNQYDLAGMVHAKLQECSLPKTVTKESIENKMKELAESLEKCTELCSHIEESLGSSFDQASSTSCENEKTKEEIQLLENEAGYAQFLHVFHEAFKRLSGLQLKRLQLSEPPLKEAVLMQQRAGIEKQSFLFLKDVAHFNTALIHRLLEESALKAEQEKQRGDVQIALPLSHHRAPILEKVPAVQGAVLDGESLQFGKNGELLSSTRFIKGKREGESLFYYPNGMVASLQRYKDGKWEGEQQFFHRDGRLKATIQTTEGYLNGKTLLYYPDGSLFRELSFSNGKKEGVERLWNSERLQVLEAHYSQGRPIGKTRSWYDNGNLARENIYDDEGICLERKQWREDGIPISPEKDPEDYFDRVAEETGKLSHSLGIMVYELGFIVPAFQHKAKEAKKENIAIEIQNDLVAVQKKLAELEALKKTLFHEMGLDSDSTKENFWKTPSSQKLLENQIEKMSKLLSLEISTLGESIARLASKMQPPS